MKKSATGIPGFDKLVDGGFPANSNILISGPAGAAKSIFSIQYIYNGVTKFKEPGLYVSFEQNKQSIIDQCSQFGWNIVSLEKKGLFHMICIPVKDINHTTFADIIEYVKKNKIKRLVIDSLSTLSINAPMYSAINTLFLKDLTTQNNIYSPSISGDYILKRFIYVLIGELQNLDATTLLIAETDQGNDSMSKDSVSEFLCDGIVRMMFESMGGKYSRSLLVRKMRHTKNDEDLHPVEICNKGIIVHEMK